MARTTEHEQMRQKLMRNAIRIAAREGLEHLTTKKIASASALAEVYIYRYFDGKDHLLEECFFSIDNQIASAIVQSNEGLATDPSMAELFVRNSWYAVWNYLVRHPEHTLFYFRFYLSQRFTDQVAEVRSRIFVQAVEQCIRMFADIDDLDRRELVDHANYILECSLTCAVRLIRDKLYRNKTTAMRVDRDLLYRLIALPIVRMVMEKRGNKGTEYDRERIEAAEPTGSAGAAD